MELCLRVYDKNGNTIAIRHGFDEISLMCPREYQEGDHLVLEISEPNAFVWLQLDDALGKSLVYLTGNVEYLVPFGEKRVNLSPKAFSGKIHLLYARAARDYEIHAYRNLAVNVNDQHGDVSCFPHASANVETRGEAVFAAKNAIDGVVISDSHGNWPYASWGINRRDDAKMRLDFGRMVEIDRIHLYTRSDFPHDNWWTEATFTFSDGSTLVFPMEKSDRPHELTFEKKQVEWLEIGELKKAPGPSPFPALTQIEVYGTDL
ncbi:MAG: carbohydrate-binding protein [Eubacteriales bacterium]|nr:carbohydrate-binding protein [Eubacteriales bacterium]